MAGAAGRRKAAEQPPEQAQPVPKLRLKLSDHHAAAAEANKSAGGPTTGGILPAKLSLKLRLARTAAGADDKAGAAVRQASQQHQQQQQPVQPERQGTLKLRLKLGEGGGIPQVDGAADAAEPDQGMADGDSAGPQPDPSLTDGAGTAEHPQVVSLAGSDGQLEQAGQRQSPGHGKGLGEGDTSTGTLAMAKQQPDLELAGAPVMQQPAETTEQERGEPAHAEASLPAAGALPAEGNHRTEHDGGHPDAPSALLDQQSVQPEAGPELPADTGEAHTSQPLGIQEGHGGVSPSEEEGAAHGLVQPEHSPLPDNQQELNMTPGATNGLAADFGSPSGEGSQWTPGLNRAPLRPLSQQEQEGLPALLAMLRAWLKRHGGLTPLHARLANPEVPLRSLAGS